MVLLSAPFDRSRPIAPGLPWLAIVEVAASALGVAVVGVAVDAIGGPVRPFGRALMSGAAHAGFLALGVLLLADGRPGWRGPALRLAAVVIAASLLSRAGGWGPAAYLALPMAVVAELGRSVEARAAGLTWPSPGAAVLGLAAGAFMGGHLLVASSLTFGYAVGVGGRVEYLSAVAYDLGVSAVTAEWLFRGAIFTRWWRRWAFGAAAALSSGCAVARYLLDPNLPQTVDARLGAIFYLGLLGFMACALRAWSGSLVPGYLATAGFFVAYRALSA
jgi:hypothetical protein